MQFPPNERSKNEQKQTADSLESAFHDPLRLEEPKKHYIYIECPCPRICVHWSLICWPPKQEHHFNIFDHYHFLLDSCENIR